MLNITNMTDLRQLYRYQLNFPSPQFLPADFESWKASFLEDVDGEGRTLFATLRGKVACDGNVPVGFIQYGRTAFGFDEHGEISHKVHYCVVRSLYFDEGHPDAGRLLLQEAMAEFAEENTVYAFFHYFGMSCFGRHGKLFEEFAWIRALLEEFGFTVEHENVYYCAALDGSEPAEATVVAQGMTPGGEQTFDLLLDGTQVGGCAVHYSPVPGCAYLRWIYINGEIQNRGIGSQCMAALKKWLHDQGITRLDTDTALNNLQAQRYYEKNAFARRGITRSYYRIR